MAHVIVTCLGKLLGVAFPDTVLEERDTLRDKTVKLGLIARACSIYGVDVIEIFRDEKKRGESNLIRKVLEYLETPQYLRRRIYPLEETFKFAGLLPPLRIPSHKPKVPVESLRVGEFREGVTNGDGTVDIGLDKSPRLEGGTGENRRVTVRLTSVNPLKAELVRREEVSDYWGYAVEVRSLDDVLSDKRFGVKIGTSRYGNALRAQLPRLQESVRGAAGIELVFGSPTRGLFDLAGADLPKRADYVVNLFADQHVETVRTEEAIFAGLNLVNTLVF